MARIPHVNEASRQLDLTLARIPVLLGNWTGSIVRVPLIGIQLATHLLTVPLLGMQVMTGIIGQMVTRLDAVVEAQSGGRDAYGREQDTGDYARRLGDMLGGEEPAPQPRRPEVTSARAPRAAAGEAR